VGSVAKKRDNPVKNGLPGHPRVSLRERTITSQNIYQSWTQYYGTAQATDFSLSTWYRLQAVLDGVGLVGYKQLQRGDCSVLPAISQTKTLPFLQYWYYTMALSKKGNHADGYGILPSSLDCDLRNDVTT
jgi:hypothetical protein